MKLAVSPLIRSRIRQRGSAATYSAAYASCCMCTVQRFDTAYNKAELNKFLVLSKQNISKMLTRIQKVTNQKHILGLRTIRLSGHFDSKTSPFVSRLTTKYPLKHTSKSRFLGVNDPLRAKVRNSFPKEVMITSIHILCPHLMQISR